MVCSNYLRLGVNIDHVATVRNARGSNHPDPVDAAILAEEAGADGITAHLREDRRHIRDRDIARLKDILKVPLNLEMAATQEMQQIALRHDPHAICLVPERRQERTTEAGLDVVGQLETLQEYIKPLKNAGCRISFFVGTDPNQIIASAQAGAQVVEIHTGPYCEAQHNGQDKVRSEELEKIISATQKAHELGLEVHAGHGLNFQSVRKIASIGIIKELNIGHFLIGEAIFSGLKEAVQAMRQAMDDARKGTP